MSMPRRSRTARPYSARFNRWNGRQPGFGFAIAAASTLVSSALTNADTVSGSGRRDCGGGIMPARSFRIIFSVTLGWAVTFDASKPARTRPPALPRSLWQLAQY